MKKPVNTVMVFASAALLTSLSFYSLAGADESGVYVGGSFGTISVNDSEFDDDSDVSQLFVGWRVNSVLGFEVNRMDFSGYGNNIANAETDGYGLAITGHLPISEFFALYGKAGQFWWDTDAEVLGFTEDFDGEEPFASIGALFSLTDSLLLDISYQRMNIDLDDDEVGPISTLDLDSQVDVASLGLRVKF